MQATAPLSQSGTNIVPQLLLSVSATFLACGCVVQIDLRFASPAQGNLEVVVAPVLRFADVGYNAGRLNDAAVAVAMSAFLHPANHRRIITMRKGAHPHGMLPVVAPCAPAHFYRHTLSP